MTARRALEPRVAGACSLHFLLVGGFPKSALCRLLNPLSMIFAFAPLGAEPAIMLPAIMTICRHMVPFPILLTIKRYEAWRRRNLVTIYSIGKQPRQPILASPVSRGKGSLISKLIFTGGIRTESSLFQIFPQLPALRQQRQ